MPQPAPIPPGAADAAKERAESEPPILYKYRTAEQAIRMLETRTVAFTCPLTFNDPLDCQWNPIWNGSDDAFFESCAREHWRWTLEGPPPDLARRSPERAAYYREAGRLARGVTGLDARSYRENNVRRFLDDRAAMRRTLEAQLRRCTLATRVLCLSKEPASLPMWAHYADEHRGAVLGLVPSRMTFEQGESDLSDVRYGSALPEIVPTAALREITLYGDRGLFAGRTFEDVLFWKHDSWAYEQERRMVLRTRRRYSREAILGKDAGALDEAPDLRIFGEDVFARVILGPRCGAAEEERIARALRGWKQPPPVFRLSWETTVPRLTPVSLDA